MTIINGILFLFIAAIYSSAGFGGGSMYLALLAQTGKEISWIRFTALICNAAVTGQGTWKFARKGWLAAREVGMLLLFSVPPCVFGAAWKLTDQYYYILLAVCLLIAAIAMFRQPADHEVKGRPVNSIWLYPAASLIGFISGITGIGGGVYLSPLLHLCRWGSAKHIAAASALFILVNSLAGITVHVYQGTSHFDSSLLLLIGCVIVGGQVGAYFGSAVFSQKNVRMLTAAIILFASLRLLWKNL